MSEKCQQQEALHTIGTVVQHLLAEQDTYLKVGIRTGRGTANWDCCEHSGHSQDEPNWSPRLQCAVAEF